MYVELWYNTQIRVGPVSQMNPPPLLADCIKLGLMGGFAVREKPNGCHDVVGQWEVLGALAGFETRGGFYMCGLATGSYFRHPPSCISTERLPTPRIHNFVDQHQEVLSRRVEFALESLGTPVSV